MKKLFLSAFALSLMAFSLGGAAQTESVDDFLGLETELYPELQGKQRFTPKGLHANPDWQVAPETVEKDVSTPLKGQTHSIIPWKTQDPEDFLSVHTWLSERKIKDAAPDWKVRLRQDEHKEVVGKILKCSGTCWLHRGTHKSKLEHLSRIHEGDEVATDKDSLAWVFLMDGSLLRVSSESSIALNEINISPREIFILSRLNQGHVFWHSRNKNEFKLEIGPETDSMSLPLMLKEANQQFYERQIYQNQKDHERLSNFMNLDEPGIIQQINKLNELKKQNNEKVSHSSKVMMVTPNSTIVGENVSFDYLYQPGGKGFFKRRSESQSQVINLHLRGYNETDIKTIEDTKWYEVQQDGRSYSALLENSGTLQVTELLTKRIKTLELARELWLKEFSLSLFEGSTSSEKLAKEFGYFLWGDELEKRLAYLIEYTRRIETTNLRSIDNLLTKLEGQGEVVEREVTQKHFEKSLNHYLLGLKKRYDAKKMSVKEMNNLEYYVWILKNEK